MANATVTSTVALECSGHINFGSLSALKKHNIIIYKITQKEDASHEGQLWPSLEPR
jgi:hypothetical protein